MKPQLYYTAPSDKQFNELKMEAMSLWTIMGDEPSYAEEKIGRIKDLPNVQDNFMVMVAMFDIFNQKRLADRLSDETRTAVRERMIDGGNPPEYIKF